MTNFKNLSHRIFFVFIIGLMAFSTDAQKFGYLNTEELILSLPEVQEANKTIASLRDSLTQKGNIMVNELRSKYMNLEAKIMEIAPSQLEIAKQQLQEEEAKIQEFDRTSQQEIRNFSEKLLQPIQDKINKAILAVAQEGEYTYIFDLSVGDVIYADEALDVSEMVKSKL
jgi:outer membrane protein